MNGATRSTRNKRDTTVSDSPKDAGVDRTSRARTAPPAASQKLSAPASSASPDEDEDESSENEESSEEEIAVTLTRRTSTRGRGRGRGRGRVRGRGRAVVDRSSSSESAEATDEAQEDAMDVDGSEPAPSEDEAPAARWPPIGTRGRGRACRVELSDAAGGMTRGRARGRGRGRGRGRAVTPQVSVAQPSDQSDADSELDAALEATGTSGSYFNAVRSDEVERSASPAPRGRRGRGRGRARGRRGRGGRGGRTTAVADPDDRIDGSDAGSDSAVSSQPGSADDGDSRKRRRDDEEPSDAETIPGSDLEAQSVVDGEILDRTIRSNSLTVPNFGRGRRSSPSAELSRRQSTSRSGSPAPSKSRLRGSVEPSREVSAPPNAAKRAKLEQRRPEYDTRKARALATVEYEMQLIEAGAHPIQLDLYERLEAERDRQLEYAALQELLALDHVSELERQTVERIWTWWQDEKRDLRSDILQRNESTKRKAFSEHWLADPSGASPACPTLTRSAGPFLPIEPAPAMRLSTALQAPLPTLPTYGRHPARLFVDENTPIRQARDNDISKDFLDMQLKSEIVPEYVPEPTPIKPVFEMLPAPAPLPSPETMKLFKAPTPPAEFVLSTPATSATIPKKPRSAKSRNRNTATIEYGPAPAEAFIAAHDPTHPFGGVGPPSYSPVFFSGLPAFGMPMSMLPPPPSSRPATSTSRQPVPSLVPNVSGSSPDQDRRPPPIEDQKKRKRVKEFKELKNVDISDYRPMFGMPTYNPQIQSPRPMPAVSGAVGFPSFPAPAPAHNNHHHHHQSKQAVPRHHHHPAPARPGQSAQPPTTQGQRQSSASGSMPAPAFAAPAPVNWFNAQTKPADAVVRAQMSPRSHGWTQSSTVIDLTSPKPLIPVPSIKT